jgi:hypothetical protein
MNSTKKGPKSTKNTTLKKDTILKIVRTDRVDGKQVRPEGYDWVHVEEKTLRGKTFDTWKREEKKPLTRKEQNAVLANTAMKSLSIGDTLVHYKSWHPPRPSAAAPDTVPKSRKRSLKKPKLTRTQLIIQRRRRIPSHSRGLEAIVDGSASKEEKDEAVDDLADMLGKMSGGSRKATRKATRKVSKRRKPRRPVPWWHF